ncbi:hypothetical protein jhhlp_000771 [Lomentospora prolificans]|uniref:Uncharacterized protein n=1 Tax=Lomentospora prolificans TaxID=41688 RepID=A0A2N3NJF4_9PEZI|nr:hypothetical protein jhhlp_000771 [Lomentospora prolificans]
MRKLGHGQSVVFCVPREIRTKIGQLLYEGGNNYDNYEIKVADILIWSICETWISLQRGVQLWAAQGWRHQKHQRLWYSFTQNRDSLTSEQAREFLEDEAQTILQRYRPDLRRARTTYRKPGPINDRLRDFGMSTTNAAALNEEQERELDPETERERQLERPGPTVPAAHRIHPHIRQFIINGTVVRNSTSYMRAFDSLSNTTMAKEFGMPNIPKTFAAKLLVSRDFSQTVKIAAGLGISPADYLRPVQWILTNKGQNGETFMIIISPFEANNLIDIVAQSKATRLHLYCPRVNSAFPSLDDLRLFAYPEPSGAPIPQGLTTGLNLFAGQLYFNDYEMYTAACRFLGLSWQKAEDGEVLGSDGFIEKDVWGRTGGESGFLKSPVKFMRDLMEIRVGSQSSPRTHVGAMLGNRLLSKEDFKIA